MYLYINMWSVSFYLHSFISWDLNQSFKFVTKTWPNPPVFESFESEWKAVPPQNSPNKKIFTDKHFGKLVSEPLGCLLWFSMGHNSFGLFSLDVSREADGFLPGFVFAKVNVPLFHLWIYKACQRHCQTGGQYECMKNICYICFFFFIIHPWSLQLFKECRLLSRQHHYNIINKRHWCEGQQICFPVCQSLKMDFLYFF